MGVITKVSSSGTATVNAASSGTVRAGNNSFLALKGDKGDPFTYEDFTPEQLEALKGDKGDGATIKIGTVTKGDNASVTNTGTATAAILNFVLPKGDKGDPFTYEDFTPEQLEGLKGADGTMTFEDLAVIANAVPAYAFYGNSQLATVEIPESMTGIGSYAFYNCTNLALTELPEGLIYIGQKAFYGCEAITELTFKTTPASIASDAFVNCDYLTTINVPWAEGEVAGAPWGADAIINYNHKVAGLYDESGVLASSWNNLVADGSITLDAYGTSITKCSTDLAGELIVSDGVTSISNSAFYDCTNLTSIKLPEGIITINGNAFDGCINLTSINLPDGVTYISNSVFENCTNLTLTELPEGVIGIGRYAFKGCTKLALAKLPDGVTDIGDSAFSGCTNLALTELPEGVTKINNSAFYNCTNLALTELPSGITGIGSYAFYNCSNLALTELPDGVKYISLAAFERCSSLALYKLPDSLTSISNSAFEYCTNLALTAIPASVTSIDSHAFSSCSSLTELTFKGKPNYIGDWNVFENCSNLKTINVPWAEGEVANAPWGATNATINYNYTGE